MCASSFQVYRNLEQRSNSWLVILFLSKKLMQQLIYRSLNWRRRRWWPAGQHWHNQKRCTDIWKSDINLGATVEGWDKNRRTALLCAHLCSEAEELNLSSLWLWHPGQSASWCWPWSLPRRRSGECRPSAADGNMLHRTYRDTQRLMSSQSGGRDQTVLSNTASGD